MFQTLSDITLESQTNHGQKKSVHYNPFLVLPSCNASEGFRVAEQHIATPPSIRLTNNNALPPFLHCLPTICFSSPIFRLKAFKARDLCIAYVYTQHEHSVRESIQIQYKSVIVLIALILKASFKRGIPAI